MILTRSTPHYMRVISVGGIQISSMLHHRFRPKRYFPCVYTNTLLLNISVFLKVSTSHIKSLSSRDFQLSVNSVTFSVFSCEEPLTSVFMGGKTQNLRKDGMSAEEKA